MDENIVNENEESTSFTLLKAISGALIGTIPAAVLWITMGKAGYISSLCGFFMIFGEMYMCGIMTRESKDMNIETAIVVCIVVTLVMVYLCERAVWSWDIYDALAPDVPGVLYCFTHFERLITGLEISSDFDSELFRSYIFAALGAVTSSFRALKFDPESK